MSWGIASFWLTAATASHQARVAQEEKKELKKDTEKAEMQTLFTQQQEKKKQAAARRIEGQTGYGSTLGSGAQTLGQ